MKNNNAICANIIKKELKEKFSRTKFSVKSNTYSSIRISWVDNETTKEVHDIIFKYEFGFFNGQTDNYEYTNRNDSIPQVQFIFCNRTISYNFAQKLANIINDRYQLNIKIQKNEFLGWECVDNNILIPNFRCYPQNLILEQSLITQGF